jgi:hypothetical protein
MKRRRKNVGQEVRRRKNVGQEVCKRRRRPGRRTLW